MPRSGLFPFNLLAKGCFRDRYAVPCLPPDSSDPVKVLLDPDRSQVSERVQAVIHAIAAQEQPVRNVSTAGFNCVNPMRKPVADATRSSARPVFSFIERSTRSPRTGNVESEKELKTSQTAAEDVQGFFQSVRVISSSRISCNRWKPPFLVGGCRSISPVHMCAVRFTNLGYFFPKFLDTL